MKKTVEITPAMIFANGKVLTKNCIDSLIGKTIAITNAEYWANTPTVRVFKLLGTQSGYVEAANIRHSQYDSLQAMWIAERNFREIAWAKNRTKLVYEGDTPYATMEDSNPCLPKGTFFGSDSDRAIYYIEL